MHHKYFLQAAALGMSLAAVTLPMTAAAATAKLMDADGGSIGVVTLVEAPSGTILHARLKGLPEGTHAFHVHSVGQCTPPFKSAGGHFNPDDSKHGLMSEDGPHVGDMPNIHVPASGALEIEILNSWLSLDDELFDDDGAAIVIHLGADDYRTDPAGAAGPRIACGVITR